MKELLSRLSKKPLSQVITLLTGIMFLIPIINKNTTINIKTEYIDFITIDNIVPSFKELLTLFILFSSDFIFELIKSFCYHHTPKTIRNNKARNNEFHAILLTFSDIFGLVSSIAGLLLLLILQKNNSINHIFCLLAYSEIAIKIFMVIFNHYHYINQAIMKKIEDNK